MFHVIKSESTRIGFNPNLITHSAVEIIEKEGINDFSQLNRRQLFAHFLKSQQLIKIFFLVHYLLGKKSIYFYKPKLLHRTKNLLQVC